jgi:hypothetical protein
LSSSSPILRSFLFLYLCPVLIMPVFGRSINPFLRTARSALQQGNSVSPVQHALRRQNAVAFVNATRSYAAVFERSKPHVNIGMYGLWLLLNHN